jgi:hypothetical protein
MFLLCRMLGHSWETVFERYPPRVEDFILRDTPKVRCWRCHEDLSHAAQAQPPIAARMG